MQNVAPKVTATLDQAINSHSVADAAEVKRLRSLGLRERGELLEAACEAAAEIERSRLAAGQTKTEPAPWPQSTWEFLRKHAPNARG